MSGHLSGIQQRILNRNQKAVFINRDQPYFGLIRSSCCKSGNNSYCLLFVVEAIYHFLVHSWWSAREEAVELVHEKLDELLGLLEQLMGLGIVFV